MVVSHCTNLIRVAELLNWFLNVFTYMRATGLMFVFHIDTKWGLRPLSPSECIHLCAVSPPQMTLSWNRADQQISRNSDKKVAKSHQIRANCSIEKSDLGCALESITRMERSPVKHRGQDRGRRKGEAKSLSRLCNSCQFTSHYFTVCV